VSAEARPANVHALPDAGAGEGVPLQPLPDAAAADRDRARALSDGAPDQDLVPEPTHEAEEGVARRQGDQRAGASGTRRAGATQAAATAAARKGGQAARRATAPGHQDGHGQGSDGRRADQGRRQGVLSSACVSSQEHARTAPAISYPPLFLVVTDVFVDMLSTATIIDSSHRSMQTNEDDSPAIAAFSTYVRAEHCDCRDRTLPFIIYMKNTYRQRQVI